MAEFAPTEITALAGILGELDYYQLLHLESDDLLELEGLDDVKLPPAGGDAAPGGKATAIDEDLTSTAPNLDSSDAEELEGDLFERPGADLSEPGDDEPEV